MSQYPVESLLRPKFEFYSAVTYTAAAGIALLTPEVVMMVEHVSWATAGALASRAMVRTLEGYRIHRYQRGLWSIAPYTMTSKQIPKSSKRLFIGRGFPWIQAHVQRLADVERHPEFTTPSTLYQTVRAFEKKCENTPVLSRLTLLTQSSHRFNPVKPQPPVGGNPAIHAVGMLEGESDLFLNQADRNGHTLVLGTTRVGKTRFLDLLSRQDISNGDVVIVFDPKGDGDLFRNMYAEAVNCGREDNFYFFHLGFPELSARYNPVGNFSRVTEISSRIAGQLPGEGQSQAFREFVWRYVNVIAKTLTALGRKADYEQIKFYGEDIEPLFIAYLEDYLKKQNHRDGAWVQDVDEFTNGYKNREEGYKPGRAFSDRNERSLALLKYFRDHEIEDFIAHSLIKTFEYEKGYLDKLVGSLLPLMEKLCTGKTAELLSPDYGDANDPRPIFDWPEVIRTGGIVYVGLDALADPEVAAAVGNSMFADLTATAGQIYKTGVNINLPTDQVGRKINLHADEFNELIRDEFIPMVNKAGGAGFQITAYTQTWSDVVARLNNVAKAGQVAGNFNNLVMLRVKELETAEMITKQLKDVEVNQTTTISATNDSSNPEDSVHFTSRTEQRISTQKVPFVHPHDIISLPKGQAFCLLDGGKPFKLRIPLPSNQDLSHIPDSIGAIAQQMQERYLTSDSWAAFDDSFVPFSD